MEIIDEEVVLTSDEEAAENVDDEMDGNIEEEEEEEEEEVDVNPRATEASTLRYSTERPEEVSRHVDENGDCFLALSIPHALTVRPRCSVVVFTRTRVEFSDDYGLVMVQSDPVPGLFVANGLVDSGYRGALGLVVVNTTELEIAVPANRLCVVLYPLYVGGVDVGNILHPNSVERVRSTSDHQVDVLANRCQYNRSDHVLRVDVPDPEHEKVVYTVPFHKIPNRLEHASPHVCFQLGDKPSVLRCYAGSYLKYFFAVDVDLAAETVADTWLSPYPLVKAIYPSPYAAFVSFDHAMGTFIVRRTKGDAAFDVCAHRDFTLVGGGTPAVFRLPVTYRRSKCRIYAVILGRSSMNARGVVVRPAAWPEHQDLRLHLVNYGTQDYTVRRGDRIAQVVFGQHNACRRICDLMPMRGLSAFNWVGCVMDLIRKVSRPMALQELAPGDAMTESDRAEGGFGSTGR